MAWVTVPGTDDIWQYDNAATKSDTYSDAPGSYVAGIRIFTHPNGKVQETYVKCRKKNETTGGSGNDGLRGELAKI